MNVVQFMWSARFEILRLSVEHVFLVALAIGIAIAVGVPLGILMTRRNLTEPEAFRFLQRQSQDRRMPMAKLAESIVQADELLDGGSGGGPGNFTIE